MNSADQSDGDDEETRKWHEENDMYPLQLFEDTEDAQVEHSGEALVPAAGMRSLKAPTNAAEPAIKPPAAKSAIKPPAIKPPAIKPPAIKPPAAKPPAAKPPATEPPATKPPAAKPPVNVAIKPGRSDTADASKHPNEDAPIQLEDDSGEESAAEEPAEEPAEEQPKMLPPSKKAKGVEATAHKKKKKRVRQEASVESESQASMSDEDACAVPRSKKHNRSRATAHPVWYQRT